MRPRNPSNELKFKDNDPAPGGALEVIIQRNGELRISPEEITLNNKIHTVRWRCVDLARGERLQIYFPQDPNGPFLSLESFEQVPGEVNGYGNRGLEETLKEYKYEAQVLKQKNVVKVALGHLINNATIRVNHPHSGGPGDPPIDPLKPPSNNPSSFP